MLPLLLVPAALQMLAMFLDEFVFHRARGLPKWERVGHPLDTISAVLCFAWLVRTPPDAPYAIGVYVALCAFSCAFITKDEFVHSRRCLPAEQWLHSLLFVLHPIVLGAAALLWLRHGTALLAVQSALTLAFGCYQLLYWNLPWTRHPRAQ